MGPSTEQIADRAKRTAYMRIWRKANPEKVRAAGRAYRIAHRKELAAYEAAHRETRNARDRVYYAANRERVLAYNRTYRSGLGPIVYAWFAPDGTAEWVGRGTRYRATQHRMKPWWTPQPLLLSMTCDSEWQAMEYEGRWGARYQPVHNREGYRHAQA